MERPAGEPGVEAAERASIGPPGVRADRGLDQPARGRCRPSDLGLFGVGPGGRILHVKGKSAEQKPPPHRPRSELFRPQSGEW